MFKRVACLSTARCMRKQDRPRPWSVFRCVCGYDQAQNQKALDSHMSRRGCSHLINAADLPDLPEERARKADAADLKAGMEFEGKKARARNFEDERRDCATMKLSRKRFVQLVAGSSIDSFKADVITLNAMGLAHAVAEIRKLIPDVDDERFEHAKAVLTSAFDMFNGIETEKKEMAHLKRLVPIVTPVPRVLAGTGGQVAYDFKMDEVLLRLVEHCPVARQQCYDTIVSYRMKKPLVGQEGSSIKSAKKIIVDIVDAKVWENHAIFGAHTRMLLDEALAMSPTASLQFAILLYNDAFTARTYLSNKHVTSATPLLPASFGLPRR